MYDKRCEEQKTNTASANSDYVVAIIHIASALSIAHPTIREILQESFYG
jgi:hypothetical protein